MTEEEKKKAEDPFAGVREALYKQKPETREAEIRAQRNRAKATAFLQAFGSIADAFTLHQGGDVVKRDLNPYVMNNMQRADAMGEQDRADKRAWENSWLNLENSIAQYGIRQQELERQKAWRDEERKEQQDFQRETAKAAQEDWKERESIGFQRRWDEMNAKFGQNVALYGLKADKDKEIAAQKYRQQLGIEALKFEGRKVLNAMKPTAGSGKAEKPYMSIVDPDNPAKMQPINENAARLLWAHLLKNRRNDERIRALIKSKQGNYTEDEKKEYLLLFSQRYPEVLVEYLGVLAPELLSLQTAASAAATTQATQTATTPPPAADGEMVNMPPPPPPADSAKIVDEYY
jgi:hypothetical protein